MTYYDVEILTEKVTLLVTPPPKAVGAPLFRATVLAAIGEDPSVWPEPLERTHCVCAKEA
jgi:hypothetical protein